MTSKQSNPFSTGGGGNNFENQVQTVFLTLMACKGSAPTLPKNPISKLQYQAKCEGFNTDDLVVYSGDNKLLIQIKHSITISKKDTIFKQILENAWSDFNNTELFNKEKDSIALITGQINKIDIKDTLVILDWARTSENEQDFYGKVKITRFSSENKRKKLEAFLIQIKSIDLEATDEAIFDFLKRFYWLGFDLDITGSVNRCLLETLLSQYYNGQAVFDFLKSISQEYNQGAGVIKYNEVIEKLEEQNFPKKEPIDNIPYELRNENIQKSWGELSNAKELALANLIGSWDENNKNDKLIIAEIVGKNYEQWIEKIRPFLHQENSPVKLHNGIWNVINREALWNDLASHIYDNELDNLQDNALIILREKDPRFELKISERYFANIKNKILKYSPILRNGIAETIAIIGNNSDKLKNCHFDKKTYLSSLITSEIFKDADWILWGSLNNLLPTLAQASPDIFLKEVKKTITQTPELFIKLFNQEGDGLFGGSETTGLLWALEALAWDESQFANACMILADLAAIDPGGKMTNRPANSLSTILLPWLPRTNATIDKRKNLVKAIVKQHQSVAWNLLLTLLHNRKQISTCTYKPTWLKGKIDVDKDVLKRDYWKQNIFYTDLIVSMAKNDVDKLIVLVKNIGYLITPKAFNSLLKKISSNDIRSLSEEKRLPLYFAMIDLTVRHIRFKDAEWALPIEKINEIEKVAEKLKPQDLFNLHQRLFTDYDYNLYEESENYEQQIKALDIKRENAIKEILNKQGLNRVIDFALIVKNSKLIGSLLSKITNVDKDILPNFLTTENAKKRDFIAGYVYRKYANSGLDWIKSLNVSRWSVIEKANLLKSVEPKPQVWQKALEWLGDQENLYWGEVFIHPYQYDKNEFVIAIDKLIKYQRPNGAISIINAMIHKNHPLDIKRSIKALLQAGQVVKEKKSDPFIFYDIIEVIRSLQQSTDVPQDDLFKIEWMYLANISEVGMDIQPITLENKIATDPDFFCELVQYAYRSFNDNSDKKKLNKHEENRSQASYNLLDRWKTIPGFTGDDFSVNNFNNWLNSVKNKCKKSGHSEIALEIIGKTLIHTPEDKSGLWINKTIAQVLNSEDSENMRKGFHVSIFNSRGVHMLDSTGNKEDELANKYLKQANELGQAGYINFAQTLKNVSSDYKKDAKRVRNEAKN